MAKIDIQYLVNFIRTLKNEVSNNADNYTGATLTFIEETYFTFKTIQGSKEEDIISELRALKIKLLSLIKDFNEDFKKDLSAFSKLLKELNKLDYTHTTELTKTHMSKINIQDFPNLQPHDIKISDEELRTLTIIKGLNKDMEHYSTLIAKVNSNYKAVHLVFDEDTAVSLILSDRLKDVICKEILSLRCKTNSSRDNLLQELVKI